MQNVVWVQRKTVMLTTQSRCDARPLLNVYFLSHSSPLTKDTR